MYPSFGIVHHIFAFARAGVALGPMPKVAALLNDSVLKLMLLRVVGFAVATEVRLLPIGAAVTVLARVLIPLGESGADEAVEDAATVTTVTLGGGGGRKEAVAVISVVEATNDAFVGRDVLAASVGTTVTTTTVLDCVSAVGLLLAPAPSPAAPVSEICTDVVTVAVCVCSMVIVVKDASLMAACDCLTSAVLAFPKLS